MLKHYVELDYPGTFFPETTIEEIPSRETFKPKLGRGLYAFTFFDREVIEQNGETLAGKEKNRSKRTLIGKRVAVDILERDYPEAAKNCLLSNARCNGWDILVLCPAGNWQPLQAGEKLIEIKDGNACA